MAQPGLAVIVVLAVGGQLAVTAQPQAVDTTAETHCVVYVTDQLASGELVVTAPLCFDSFADAIVEASGGEVKISSGSELFTDSDTGALLATFTLGIHYDGYSGAGSSITVVGSSCTGGWWNTGAAWANRISSSYNGCYRLRHHDLPDRQGIYGDTTDSGAVHNVPAPINNKAESVSYWGS